MTTFANQYAWLIGAFHLNAPLKLFSYYLVVAGYRPPNLTCQYCLHYLVVQKHAKVQRICKASPDCSSLSASCRNRCLKWRKSKDCNLVSWCQTTSWHIFTSLGWSIRCDLLKLVLWTHRQQHFLVAPNRHNGEGCIHLWGKFMRNNKTTGPTEPTNKIWRTGHLAIYDVSDLETGIARHLWPKLSLLFKSWQSIVGKFGLEIVSSLPPAQGSVLNPLLIRWQVGISNPVKSH